MSNNDLNNRALSRLAAELEMEMLALEEEDEEAFEDRSWFRIGTAGMDQVEITGLNWFSAFGAAIEILEMPLPRRISTTHLPNGAILLRDIEAERLFTITPLEAAPIQVVGLLDEG